MRFSDSLANIGAALAKVQGEIKNPIKNQKNEGVKGNPLYANLEDTLQDYVRPICSKNGISIFQSVKTDESGKVGVCTLLLHESGEYIEGDYAFCDVVIPLSKEGKKVLTEGQATGVCITYLRRYSLNAALGINGDKDTDGAFEKYEEEPLTFETALDLEITFGKHKGKKLKDIWESDLQYIKWLKENESTDARIKEAIALIDTRKSEMRLNALLERCKNDNVDTSKIEKLYKVSDLAELSENQHANINKNWEKIKAAE